MIGSRCCQRVLPFFAMLSTALAGEIIKDLSPAEQEQLMQGKQIMHTKDVSGHPWPQATVYQWFPAEPKEVLATFFDYESAVRFVPNVIKARVSEVKNPWDKEVSYEVKVPLFPDEWYICRNVLTRTGIGNQLQIRWSLVRARSLRSAEGDLTVEPLRGGTLVRYRNLTDPGSLLAPVLKRTALGQMQKTVASLGVEVARRKQNPNLMRVNLTTLDQALQAKDASPPRR
jgi:hypothetical protein